MPSNWSNNSLNFEGLVQEEGGGRGRLPEQEDSRQVEGSVADRQTIRKGDRPVGKVERKRGELPSRRLSFQIVRRVVCSFKSMTAFF